MMRVSYNKLWKLLIDKRMNKQDLKEVSGVSGATVAKLGRGDNVTTDVLVKICTALDCNITDIMELTDETDFDRLVERSNLERQILK